MTVKRALIVDDSRSARVILSRMLETHGLQVDTAESAEQALEYLRNTHPDVVFMDHLMPGMDGFEAVRVIKSNAATADIPVMMYTSQDGEHYALQARRAGARGVLSKTLKSSDVSRALYDLRLLPDRRESRATGADHDANRHFDRDAPAHVVAFTPADAADAEQPGAPADAAANEQKLRAAVIESMAEQRAELERAVQSSVEALGERLMGELRAGLQQLAMPAQSVAPDEVEASGSRGWLAAALVVAALIPTAVIATLYWRTLDDNQAQLQQSNARLAMVVTEQQTQIEQLRAELRRRQEVEGPLPLAGGDGETVAVPYGEPPFFGERVRRVKLAIDRLRAENFKGTVRAASFTGDFCLSGNAINGYKLARDDLPMRQCDLIGNPFEDGLTAAARQSSEFAGLLTDVPATMRIEVLHGGRAPIVPYPERNERTTAGEWNRVAARNNRVEISALPAD